MGDSTEFCSYNFILYIQVLSVVEAGYVHFPSTNCVCLTDCFLH